MNKNDCPINVGYNCTVTGDNVDITGPIFEYFDTEVFKSVENYESNNRESDKTAFWSAKDILWFPATDEKGTNEDCYIKSESKKAYNEGTGSQSSPVEDPHYQEIKTGAVGVEQICNADPLGNNSTTNYGFGDCECVDNNGNLIDSGKVQLITGLTFNSGVADPLENGENNSASVEKFVMDLSKQEKVAWSTYSHNKKQVTKAF